MVDAGIGRLLISSLHQGIADVSPSRLDFYENWLSPSGMRDGRIGVAPLGAVLSFLHREEAPLNEQIANRAGVCAADWTYEELSGLRRWYIQRLPLALRSRAALSLGKRLVLATVKQSKVKRKIKGADASMDIESALCQQLRDPATVPMRGFYAAALQRLFAHCNVDAAVAFSGERPGGLTLAVTVNGALPPESADAA
jgi:hypothetical protein